MAGAVLLLAVPLLILHRASLAQPGFKSLSTVRIEVKYQRGITAAQAQKVADYLQSEYDYLSARIGVDIDRRLETRVYDASGKYLDATRQNKAWRPALFRGGILHVQPVSVLEERSSFETGLSYELVCALMEKAVARGCPRWLAESFAVYHSGIMTTLSPPVGKKVAAFGDLDQEMQDNPVPPRRDDVLYLLGQTMRFFVDRYGEEKAMSLFSGFDGEKGVDTVFRERLGESLADAEKAWAEEIALHSEPVRRDKE
jgi:hypothetical protein